MQSSENAAFNIDKNVVRNGTPEIIGYVLRMYQERIQIRMLYKDLNKIKYCSPATSELHKKVVELGDELFIIMAGIYDLVQKPYNEEEQRTFDERMQFYNELKIPFYVKMDQMMESLKNDISIGIERDKQSGEASSCTTESDEPSSSLSNVEQESEMEGGIAKIL